MTGYFVSGCLSFIQAKFHDIDENLQDQQIPWEPVLRAIKNAGYTGYLSSEYEGNRHIQDAFPVDSVEQVRRQHAMFARLLGETTGEDA